MKEISLTINGQPVKAQEGQTLLEIGRANGIDIPTLCHFDGLTDIGACRLCVVDVEKERRPVPSCTYPVRDGLVVRTSTPQLEKYRRLILELIFTERNHYCMFCERSGDCELQKLAYRYQIDSVRYPYSFPVLPVDSLSDSIAIDHGRCVLCGRCVRACGELVGTHTIDFARRGWKTVISADLEQPLSESSCISCGACMQACPTGAIFSKLSMYRGRTADCQAIHTICPGCGVACELKVLVRDNNLVSIESPSLDGRGILCEEGRYGLLKNGRHQITVPMIRNRQDKLEEVTLKKALDTLGRELPRLKDSGFAGIASTRYPTETLKLFRRFVRGAMGSEKIDTLDGTQFRSLTQGISQFRKGACLDIESSAEIILSSDCIVVAGADPLRTHSIVGSYILRAVNAGARLIVIDTVKDPFSLWSSQWLKPAQGTEGALFNALAALSVKMGFNKNEPAEAVRNISGRLEEASRIVGIEIKELEVAAGIYGAAVKPVIVFGRDLLEPNYRGCVAALLNLAGISGGEPEGKLRVVALKDSANSRGAWTAGLAGGFNRNEVNGAYVLLADEPINKDLIDWLKTLDFVVVQAPYESPATAIASVVLPAANWAGQEGTWTSMDGVNRNSQRVLATPDGQLNETALLAKIAQKLGYAL